MLTTFRFPALRDQELSLWNSISGDLASFLADNISKELSGNLHANYRTPAEKVRTVVTGHSLGGGVAQVMATRHRLPAVVFSSPGISYVSQRFHVYNAVQEASLKERLKAHFQQIYRRFSHAKQVEIKATPVAKNTLPADFHGDYSLTGIQDALRQVITVAPQGDVVPQVDMAVGSVQRISCRDPRSAAFGSAARCHRLEQTTCEIWRVCGDTRPTRAMNCEEFVPREALRALGGWYTLDDDIAP
jgi:pimeloyl-ACP methyl ester carboxylesterase